jgi:sterol desaturase/sphingolipid hydroxylase (fatty acid hydroxylase superfamily)
VPLILVPISLLIRADAAVLIICVMILRFIGQMTHANSRISYGPFRYLIAEPRFHRIHHSVETRHLGKNFAFMFPVWDMIFGTAYFPAQDEYPKTGLADQKELRSVVRCVVSPFERKYGMRRHVTTRGVGRFRPFRRYVRVLDFSLNFLFMRSRRRP